MIFCLIIEPTVTCFNLRFKQSLHIDTKTKLNRAIILRLKSMSLRTHTYQTERATHTKGSLDKPRRGWCAAGMMQGWTHRHLFENDTWLWLAASATPDPFRQAERMPGCWD